MSTIKQGLQPTCRGDDGGVSDEVGRLGLPSPATGSARMERSASNVAQETAVPAAESGVSSQPEYPAAPEGSSSAPPPFTAPESSQRAEGATIAPPQLRHGDQDKVDSASSEPSPSQPSPEPGPVGAIECATEEPRPLELGDKDSRTKGQGTPMLQPNELGPVRQPVTATETPGLVVGHGDKDSRTKGHSMPAQPPAELGLTGQAEGSAEEPQTREHGDKDSRTKVDMFAALQPWTKLAKKGNVPRCQGIRADMCQCIFAAKIDDETGAVVNGYCGRHPLKNSSQPRIVPSDSWPADWTKAGCIHPSEWVGLQEGRLGLRFGPFLASYTRPSLQDAGDQPSTSTDATPQRPEATGVTNLAAQFSMADLNDTAASTPSSTRRAGEVEEITTHPDGTVTRRSFDGPAGGR